MSEPEHNPWVSVWCHPRRTIREIISLNENHRINLLSFLYGFLLLLNTSKFYSLGGTYSVPLIFVISLVLAWPIGVISFNLNALLYFIVGKIFRGVGSYRSIRAAFAWSNVPVIVLIVLWLVLLGAYGPAVFLDPIANYQGVTLAQLCILLQFAVSIWGVVIFLHAFGEVEGFSAWKALICLILVAIFWFVLWTVVTWGILQI